MKKRKGLGKEYTKEYMKELALGVLEISLSIFLGFLFILIFSMIAVHCSENKTPEWVIIDE